MFKEKVRLKLDKTHSMTMWVIYNNILPFKGYKAINLCGVVFARGKRLNNRTINHELIHTAQMQELLYIGFYLWYFVEWIIKLIYYRNWDKAYRNIGFEKEAYQHDREYYLDNCYLKRRRHYQWLIRKK